MKLLILGGTRFIGLHLVRAGLASGHELTLFNRGRHDPGVPIGDVEMLHGDRGGDLGALRGRSWDAVIDTSGYSAPHVRASAELLADRVAHYTFVSTISVYSQFDRMGLDEAAERLPPDAESTTKTPATYGPMKVACEDIVRTVYPDRSLIIRPGIVVGPGDYTGRFTRWCTRIAAGGEVLAPGDAAQPAQWIDARDLGEWMMRMTVAKRTGVFNVVGPAEPATLGTMLGGIRDASATDAVLVRVPEAFLAEHGLRPGGDLPFWIPADERGIFGIRNDRAIAAGLTLRPLADTVRDTLAREAAVPAPTDREVGISRARETEILRAWHATAEPSPLPTEPTRR